VRIIGAHMEADGAAHVPNPEDDTPRSWHEKPGGVLLLLTLAVCVSLGWMTGLEFQLDDFEQIHDAAHPDGEIALLGQDGPAKVNHRSRPSFVAFFRPLLHLDFMIDYRLFGADPFAFHATNLLWHLLSCFLLHRVLLGVVTGPRRRAYALTAALVYAVHPGKWGAIAWIAARGDLILVACSLGATLALIGFRRRGGSRRLVVTFIALFAGLMAKEGGVVGPAVVATLDFLYLRHLGRGVSWGRSLRVALPIALMAPAYLIFRQWQFGEYANYYAARHQSFNLEMLQRMAEDLVPTLRSQFLGWFYYEEGGFLTRLVDLYFVLLAIPLGLWTARRPLSRSKFILIGVCLYLVCALPALRFWREARGYEVSRVFYLTQIFPCLLLAIPLSNLQASQRITRWLSLLVLAATLVVLAPAVRNHLDAQWGASRIVERVRDDLRAIAAANPTPGIAFGVLDVPDQYRKAPVYGSFLRFAMGEIFIGERIDAASIPNKNVFLTSGRLRELDRPVQLLAWSAPADAPSRGRLVPYRGTGLLPAPRGERPRFPLPPEASRVDPKLGHNAATEVDLGRGIVPRDVAMLALVFNRPPEVATTLRLEFEDEYRARFEVAMSLDPERFGSTARYLIPVGEYEDWIFRGRTLRLRLHREAQSDDGSRLVALETEAAFANLELREPKARHSLADEEPIYWLRAPKDFNWLRVCFFFAGGRRTWTVHRQELIAGEEGWLGFQCSQPGRIRTPPHREDPVYWDFFAGSKDTPSLLEKFGYSELPIRWWVEGLIGEISPERPHHPQARSPDGTITLTAP
jgi:hypothetical protein